MKEYKRNNFYTKKEYVSLDLCYGCGKKMTSFKGTKSSLPFRCFCFNLTKVQFSAALLAMKPRNKIQ